MKYTSHMLLVAYENHVRQNRQETRSFADWLLSEFFEDVVIGQENPDHNLLIDMKNASRASDSAIYASILLNTGALPASNLHKEEFKRLLAC